MSNKVFIAKVWSFFEHALYSHVEGKLKFPNRINWTDHCLVISHSFTKYYVQLSQGVGAIFVNTHQWDRKPIARCNSTSTCAARVLNSFAPQPLVLHSSTNPTRPWIQNLYVRHHRAMLWTVPFHPLHMPFLINSLLPTAPTVMRLEVNMHWQ
jgi:hypothetical protein